MKRRKNWKSKQSSLAAVAMDVSLNQYRARLTRRNTIWKVWENPKKQIKASQHDEFQRVEIYVLPSDGSASDKVGALSYLPCGSSTRSWAPHMFAADIPARASIFGGGFVMSQQLWH